MIKWAVGLLSPLIKVEKDGECGEEAKAVESNFYVEVKMFPVIFICLLLFCSFFKF